MRLRRIKRAGFTVVELLVVIAIIAVLASLLVGAVGSFMNTGPQTATRANLATIKQKLDAHWKAVSDKARRETIPTAMQADILALSGATSRADSRVQDKYVEYCLTRAFPTSFSEALMPYGATRPNLTGWPGYATFLAKLGITSANVGANTTPPEVQQSVMLLVALTSGPQNTGVTADHWGSSAITTLTVNIPTPPGTAQVDGFVDGWRKPIMFTRSYQGVALKPALASAGRNSKYGINPFDPTSDADAQDNLVVVTP